MAHNKKFNFSTGIADHGGYDVVYIEAPDLAAAKEVIKQQIPAITPQWLASGAEILEVYKDNEILLSENGAIQVFDPKDKTRFVVGLNDSKINGPRRFEEENNNVDAARKHIDHATRNTNSPAPKEAKPTILTSILNSDYVEFLPPNSRPAHRFPEAKGTKFIVTNNNLEPLSIVDTPEGETYKADAGTYITFVREDLPSQEYFWVAEAAAEFEEILGVPFKEILNVPQYGLGGKIIDKVKDGIHAVEEAVEDLQDENEFFPLL